MPNLIYVLETTKCGDLIEPGAWALSNLCRGKPLPNMELVVDGVMALGSLITKNKIRDENTFTDCCWSISFGFPKKKEYFEKLITRELIF